MPAVHSRTTAREKEAALTATITTAEFVFADEKLEKEIEDAYTEFALQRAVADTDTGAIEEIIAESDASQPNLFELTLLFGRTTVSLRPNPKARSMRHCDCRDKAHECHGTYEVRKDHGTAARRKQIDATNASRRSRVKNSNAQQRKLAKLADYSGNPRVITKLKKLGDLLVD